MDFIDEKKLSDVVVNPAIDRLREEILHPLLDAISRAEALIARIDGATVTITVKLGAG